MLVSARRVLHFMVLVLMLAELACAGSASLSGDENASTVEDPRVGTSMGNTSKPRSAVIAVQLATNDNSFVPRCTLIDRLGVHSQICSLTPVSSGVLFTSISAVNCQNSQKEAVSCRDASAEFVAQKVTLYAGDIVQMLVDGTSQEFAGKLATLSGLDALGGLEFRMAAIDVTLADEKTDAIQSAFIAAAMRGTVLRLCTTIDDIASTACGRVDAGLWDMLVDAEGDGSFDKIWGQMDLSQIHDRLVTKLEDITVSAETGDEEEYWTVLVPLTEVLDTQGDDVKLTLMIDPTYSVDFVDGNADIFANHRKVCVKSLFPEVCQYDSDATTVGILDAEKDGPPVLKMPHFSVTVENLPEE